MARICLVRQNLHPLDPRVRRQMDALVAAGHQVDLVCRRGRGQPLRERAPSGMVYRLPVPHSRGSLAVYLLEYAAFLAMATALLAAVAWRRRYDLVQVSSMPDALVFAATAPRLMRTPILLDLREAMPDLFATRFGRTGHPLIRVLAALERLSIAFATHAITPTRQLRDALLKRGCRPDKLDVVMDGADERLFFPRPATPGRTGFTLVSHGTVEESFGLDTAIRAVALLRDEIPDLRLEIYGEGSRVPALRALADDLGLTDRVVITGRWIPFDELLDALAEADAGVVAMKRDAYRDMSLGNKLFELIAMGKPVIASRTLSVEAHFPADALELFASGDAEDLARAIRALHADPHRRRALVERAREAVEPYRWSNQGPRYVALVESLLAHEDDQLGGVERHEPKAGDAHKGAEPAPGSAVQP
jgi:glycosyltransferase involved in cell wall biosynthesis